MNGQRIPFRPEDESRIASVGVWGLIVAIASIASSALSFLAALVVSSRLPGAAAAGQVFGGLIGLAVAGLLGAALVRASLAFRKVALTDEADQHYLLEGFRRLRDYFRITGVLMIIGLCGAALAMCAGMIAAMSVR